MVFCQKNNPFCNCTGLPVCHASQIDRPSPARRMQGTRGSLSYCSQIVYYKKAAQIIIIATGY